MARSRRRSSSSVPATTTAAARKPKDPLVKELYGMESEIKKALQGVMPPEKFIRLALSEYRLKPKIRATSRESRLLAVMQAAQAGLEIGGIFGECGLTPYGTECKISVYYPGLIKAATNARRISQPTAIPIYEKERYVFDREIGCNAPTVQLPPDKRGKEKVAAFAQLFFDGRRSGEWVWRQDVESIRSCSQSYCAFMGGRIKSTPWVGDFEDEMWKLAALRRLLKRTPKSASDHHLAAAIEANNMDFDFSNQALGLTGSAPRAISNGTLRSALGVPESDESKEEADIPAEEAQAEAAPAPTDDDAPPPQEQAEGDQEPPREESGPTCESCHKVLAPAGMYHGKCKNPGCAAEGHKVKL